MKPTLASLQLSTIIELIALPGTERVQLSPTTISFDTILKLVFSLKDRRDDDLSIFAKL